MPEEIKFRSLTTRDIAPLMRTVGKAMREEITKAFDVLKGRIQKDEKRINELVLKADSAERRLSRHGEHLANLEGRLKSFERK